MRKNGAKLDAKFLKDYYAYHYEIEIAKSKDSMLSNESKLAILSKAYAFLNKAGKEIENSNLPSDMRRQKRYEGILLRKMAEYSKEGNEKQNYSKSAVRTLEEVIGECFELNDVKGYHFSTIELALAYWNGGEKESARRILAGIKKEIHESGNAGVENRFHAVAAIVGFIE